MAGLYLSSVEPRPARHCQQRPDERPDGAAEARERLAAALAEPAPEEKESRNPLEGLAGGVFVGRESEVEQMRESVEGALGGSGSLRLLVGEPGIGKTRTAEEVATYARLRGARVHWTTRLTLHAAPIGGGTGVTDCTSAVVVQFTLAPTAVDAARAKRGTTHPQRDVIRAYLSRMWQEAAGVARHLRRIDELPEAPSLVGDRLDGRRPGRPQPHGGL